MPMKNPPHPGQVVRRAISDGLGLTITAAAEGLGVSRKQLTQIVNEHAGMAFFFNERITEFTVAWRGMTGTIKTAAESATADAEAIAELRRRIEAQSATVDLVAEKATEAQDAANESRELLDFTKTVLAAQNDERAAFDRLLQVVDDEGSSFREFAGQALIEIRTEYGGPVVRGYLNPPAEWNLASIPASQIREIHDALPLRYRAAMVDAVTERADLTRADKMRFCAEVLEDDLSLNATNRAGRFFAEESGIAWSPFSTEPLLRWWRANQGEIEGGS